MQLSHLILLLPAFMAAAQDDSNNIGDDIGNVGADITSIGGDVAATVSLSLPNRALSSRVFSS